MMTMETRIIFVSTLLAVVLGTMLGASMAAGVAEDRTSSAACQYFHGDSIDGQAWCVADLKKELDDVRQRKLKSDL